MRLLSTLSAVTLVGFTAVGPLAAHQPLILAVSPSVATEPGYVRINARIEPSDENRSLQVTAVSEEFVRSSTIQLDGSRAPRLAVVNYPNLPAGRYEVSAVLIGSSGAQRAAESRFVIVVSTARGR